jgi:hypothetical protein
VTILDVPVTEHAQQSAYGFCFGEVLDKIMWSDVMKAAASVGGTLLFVVEAGNKNDADVVRVFNKAKWDPRNVGAEKVLKSVTFANKTSTIALQMADFLAFTDRRNAIQNERARKYLPLTDLQKVAFMQSRLRFLCPTHFPRMRKSKLASKTETCGGMRRRGSILT